MLQESGRRKSPVVAVLAMITLLLTSAFLDAALIAQYRLLDHPGAGEVTGRLRARRTRSAQG